MPLVVISMETPSVLNNTPFSVLLPEQPADKVWTLKCVNVIYFNSNREDFRIFEVRTPQLFKNGNVLFSLNKDDVATTPMPTESLAFFVNNMSGSGLGADGPFKSINLYPDIHFGRLTLDNMVFTVFVSGLSGTPGNANPEINSFSLVFEYSDN